PVNAARMHPSVNSATSLHYPPTMRLGGGLSAHPLSPLVVSGAGPGGAPTRRA
ncbi:hypothetical protein HK405_012741, partial [Cladochytrium tenue]